MKHFIIAISFSTLVLAQEKDKDLEAFRQVEQEVKNNLTEEIVKINDTFFMIKPIGGVAGNVGVFIAEEGLVLVDDQWEIIEDLMNDEIDHKDDAKKYLKNLTIFNKLWGQIITHGSNLAVNISKRF